MLVWHITHAWIPTNLLQYKHNICSLAQYCHCSYPEKDIINCYMNVAMPRKSGMHAFGTSGQPGFGCDNTSQQVLKLATLGNAIIFLTGLWWVLRHKNLIVY